MTTAIEPSLMLAAADVELMASGRPSGNPPHAPFSCP
jgi:hypothetical protein